jgi:CBS domain-containing protein
MAWLAEGLPSEGLVAGTARAGTVAHPGVPTVGPDATVADVAAAIAGWELAVVVNPEGVVLGTVRPEALAVDPGLGVDKVLHADPATVRPSTLIPDLAKTMDDDGQERILVTTPGGRLIGLVRRAELDGH